MMVDNYKIKIFEKVDCLSKIIKCDIYTAKKISEYAEWSENKEKYNSVIREFRDRIEILNEQKDQIPTLFKLLFCGSLFMDIWHCNLIFCVFGKKKICGASYYTFSAITDYKKPKKYQQWLREIPHELRWYMNKPRNTQMTVHVVHVMVVLLQYYYHHPAFYKDAMVKLLGYQDRLPCAIFPNDSIRRLDFSEFNNSINKNEALKIYERIMSSDVRLDLFYIVRHLIDFGQNKFYFITCESHARDTENKNRIASSIFTVHKRMEHELLLRKLPKDHLASYLKQHKNSDTKYVYGPCALVPCELLDKFKI
jgi:hypothetical protein